MHGTHSPVTASVRRYSTLKYHRPTRFTCTAPGARGVYLIGDFNDWNPTATPMKRGPGGVWSWNLPLIQGSHHYLFLVDGRPTLDPNAQRVDRNETDEKVSLVIVP